MSSPRVVLGPMRLPFLLLTPCCVLLGIGTAARTTAQVNLAHAALVLVGALAAHISVNSLNEHFDFTSGLDLRTTRTPFSGGSGTLPANPEAARGALATGLVALVITALIGIYFLIVCRRVVRWDWLRSPSQRRLLWVHFGIATTQKSWCPSCA